MNDLQFGQLIALGTAVLWTLSTMISTFAGKRIGALAGSLLRLIVACVAMSVYGYIARGRLLPSDAPPRTWLLLSASGIFGFFLCDMCWLKSLLLIGPRLTLLLQSLTPPVAAIISLVFLDDVLAVQQWAAMGVILAGVAWVVFEEPGLDVSPIEQGHRRRGIALAICAAVTQAVGMVFSKAGIGEYDAVAATLIRGLAALPCYLALVTVTRRWPAVRAAFRQRSAMLALTVGSIVGGLFGVSWYLIALRHAPAGVVATIVATMPVLILPFSIFVYHEKVSPRAVGGALLAVVGVALLML